MPGSCYKLHTTPTSWNNAIELCYAEQAHLVILNSVVEAKLCGDIFMEYSDRTPRVNFEREFFSVGVKRSFLTQDFRTIDGKKNTC